MLDTAKQQKKALRPMTKPKLIAILTAIITALTAIVAVLTGTVPV